MFSPKYLSELHGNNKRLTWPTNVCGFFFCLIYIFNNGRRKNRMSVICLHGHNGDNGSGRVARGPAGLRPLCDVNESHSMR